MGKLGVALLGLVAILLAILFWKNSRFGVPSPDYRVLEEDGAFELRAYPSLTLVSTPMPGTDGEEGSAFMRLFRYISGSNEAEQKVSMTTPVLTEPVDGGLRMSFVVPEDVAAEGAPTPLAAEVALTTFEGGRFAVYRFSGSWERSRLDGAAAELSTWIEERGLTPAGEPIVAGYDPPFMPPFLRRNEILVRVEP